MFSRLKDKRRVATRYDKYPNLLMPAITLAAAVIYRLWVVSALEVRRFTAYNVVPSTGEVVVPAPYPLSWLLGTMLGGEAASWFCSANGGASDRVLNATTSDLRGP